MLQKAHGAVIVLLSCWAPRATGALSQAFEPLWCSLLLGQLLLSALGPRNPLSVSALAGPAHLALASAGAGAITARGRVWEKELSYRKSEPKPALQPLVKCKAPTSDLII